MVAVPQPAAFADIKGVVELLLERLGVLDRVRFEPTDAAPFHPGKSAVLRCGGDAVGIVGGLHPEVAYALELAEDALAFELDIEKLLPYCPQQFVFVGLPRFPATVRDVAVVVDETFPSERVVQFVREWRPDLIEEVSLFDTYAGAPIPAGHKSLAYTIAYRAADRTLTDDEVNALQTELRGALTRELGVALRE